MKQFVTYIVFCTVVGLVLPQNVSASSSRTPLIINPNVASALRSTSTQSVGTSTLPLLKKKFKKAKLKKYCSMLAETLEYGTQVAPQSIVENKFHQGMDLLKKANALCKSMEQDLKDAKNN